MLPRGGKVGGGGGERRRSPRRPVGVDRRLRCRDAVKEGGCPRYRPLPTGRGDNYVLEKSTAGGLEQAVSANDAVFIRHRFETNARDQPGANERYTALGHRQE